MARKMLSRAKIVGEEDNWSTLYAMAHSTLSVCWTTTDAEELKEAAAAAVKIMLLPSQQLELEKERTFINIFLQNR
eukprot:scaffold1190_cov69-Cylindrotheca_fusiformis.AAC.9